ncbi:MAG: metal-dependent hydrolase [Anaerolineales bacterium]|nr:metal-dependent hydrolase [Anaerolineales bacterium]MCB9444065.1 metal-dependent hydrolase [Ardenticatenaceae bacterium]
MTGKSHLVAGTAVTAAALHQASYTPPSTGIWYWVALGIGMVASLLPDIDSQNAMIKSLVKGGGQPRLTNALISYRMRRRFPTVVPYLALAGIELLIRYTLAGLIGLVPGLVQHRGPTHYLVTAVGLTALVWLISYQADISPMYALSFGAGYLSHVWCDTMTRSGVRLFAPLIPKKSYHCLPRSLRLTTGRNQSYSELIALTLIGLGCGLAFTIPAGIYLPAAGIVVVGMFVATAVYERLRPGRKRIPVR